MHMHEYKYTCMLWHVYGEQKTLYCTDQFPPSTISLPETDLRSPSLTVGTFTVG